MVDRDLDGARGVCYEHRIELASAGEFLDVFVAHELVHWYADGSSYDAMPHFVEEGLADYLSLELFGLLEGRRQEHRRLGTQSTTTRALEADVGRYFELPDEESTAASRVGFEVVSRMGLERVRELARQGAGAWDYLHAAGMEPDGEAGPGSGAILSRPTVNSALE